MRNKENYKRAFAFITHRCNNHCSYCFMGNLYHKGDMPYTLFIETCNNLKKEGFKYLTFIGGEPLLHNDLFRFIEHALKEDFKCSISTSGFSSINDKIEEIFSLPLDDVTVSLDSHLEAINDMMRGSGSFQRAIFAAQYILSKGIQVRFTATITGDNYNGIIQLADFVRELGAFQLDIHVMSLKGRATNIKDKLLSPSKWHDIRCNLDTITYNKPFHISYPIMWYEGKEYEALCSFCDAKKGNRLSIMPNGDCYYCTLSIGEEDPHCSHNKIADVNAFNFEDVSPLCPIEKAIGTSFDERYKYICRFVKNMTNFTS